MQYVDQIPPKQNVTLMFPNLSFLLEIKYRTNIYFFTAETFLVHKNSRDDLIYGAFSLKEFQINNFVVKLFRKILFNLSHLW